MSLLTASKMERRIAKRSCYPRTGNGIGGRKKKGEREGDEEKRGKLIAAFCSAINDNGGPGERETFRWLRKDVALSSFSLVTPHPPLFFFPTARSAYSQFFCCSPLSPLAVLDYDKSNDNNEGDYGDRPANGVKGKNTRGTGKRLRPLCTL